MYYDVPYAPINPSAFPLLFVYPVVVGWIFLLLGKMYSRYRRQPSKMILYLMLAFLFNALGAVGLFAGLLEAFITGYCGPIYRITMPVSLLLATVATYYFMMFAKEGSWKYNRTKDVAIKVITIMLGVWLLYDPIMADILKLSPPLNWWGRDRPPGTLNLRAITQMLALVYAFAVYGLIYVNTRKIAGATGNQKYIARFYAISQGSLGMIGFYTGLLLDAIYIVITDVGYTVFLYMGWTMAMYGIYYFYKGLR